MNLKKSFLTITSTLCFLNSANAQLWGPKNYEECVLDKMKGQHQSLLNTARDACKIAFPPPPSRQTIYIDKEDWTWEQNPGNKIIIKVKKLPKGIQLEKADAIFFDECEGKQTNPAYQATAERAMFSDRFEFIVPHRTFRCARVTFTGMAP